MLETKTGFAWTQKNEYRIWFVYSYYSGSIMTLSIVPVFAEVILTFYTVWVCVCDGDQWWHKLGYPKIYC